MQRRVVVFYGRVLGGLEIEQFFLIYWELELGTCLQGTSWAGRAAAEAEAEVEASRRGLREKRLAARRSTGRREEGSR